MSYYLSLNGTSDYIMAPSMTYDSIVLDGYFAANQGVVRQLLSSQVGGFFRINADDSTGNFYSSYTGFALGVRTTFTVKLSTPGTGNTAIFARNQGTYGDEPAKGSIYDVKFYNGATLVAHYDMSTGTVNDQTGNGHNATLTGGTWVQDTPSSTNASIPSIAATSTNSAIAPTVTATANASITSVSASSTSQAYAPTISNAANASIPAVAAAVNVQAIAPTVTTQKQVSVSGVAANSVVSAPVPSVSAAQPNVSVSAAVATVTASVNAPSAKADGNITASVTNAVSAAVAPTVSTSKAAVIAATVATAVSSAIAPAITTVRNIGVQVAAAAMIVTAINPAITLNAQEIIGKIELKGQRELYVQLLGLRQLFINLKGALPMATKYQNVEMYAGETKNIVVTVTNPDATKVDLTGATVQWFLRRQSSSSHIIAKDSTSGTSITDGPNGVLTVALSTSDTSKLAGDFDHEVVVVDISGNRSTVAVGTVTVYKSG